MLLIFRAENQRKIVRPDMVIGCDGAYSSIRKHMIQLSMFNYSQTYIDHGYLEISLPSNSNQVR